ncbi:MAG: preprotein translocase subunit SecG [Verrucomicrobiota bacterium]
MLNFSIYALTVVLVICCILLTLVVLIQRPRSEGLGAAFGGGMTDSLFGAGTTDALTKITIWMAGAFFVCTIALAMLISHRESGSGSVLEQSIEAIETEQQETEETSTPALPSEVPSNSESATTESSPTSEPTPTETKSE